MTWHPKKDDLWGYIAKRMEESYRNRERAKCSQDDYADGYIAALRDFSPRTSFKPGAEPDREPST